MLINTSVSLKTRITKYWAMSNPYERAIKGLQPILPPQNPIMDFCLRLYQVVRGKVETHRGKGGRFKVCRCTDSLQKIESEVCKTAPCFFNATHLACHSYYGLTAPFTWVLQRLQCQSMGHVVVTTGNLLTDLWELTNPQNQKIFVIHLHSECSFHLSLNISQASESLFLVQNSVSLL